MSTDAGTSNARSARRVAVTVIGSMTPTSLDALCAAESVAHGSASISASAAPESRVMRD
jgi:hypothetical protein